MERITTPTFSIIIPVYKVEEYLRQCIDSVLRQTYKNFEIILVNDGSPDNSPAICEEYAANDARVKVIHKENGGLSDARNYGLDAAKGSYVLFLDSDDWWDNFDALSIIHNQIYATNSDLLIFGLKKYLTATGEFFNEICPICRDSFTPEDCIRTGIYRASAWDKVIRRSLIEENNLRFVKGQLSEDIEWCAKLLPLAHRISSIDSSFYVYRQNQNSISHNVKRKNICDILDVIERYSKGINSADTALQHYMALQYVLLIATSTRVKNSEIDDLLKKMYRYWFLLDYRWHPLVKTASKLKFIGFKNFRFLLSLYIKCRKG